MAIKCQELDR